MQCATASVPRTLDSDTTHEVAGHADEVVVVANFPQNCGRPGAVLFAVRRLHNTKVQARSCAGCGDGEHGCVVGLLLTGC